MKKVMKRINWAYDKFNKLNEWAVIAIISAMCLVLLAQVISRFIFRKPLIWSEELARYMFVWISLLGGAWCARKHIHVRMTAVIQHFPEPVLHVQQVLVSVVCAAACFCLLKPAWTIFVNQSKLTAVTLGISLGIEYFAAPLGILMMAVENTVDALYAIFDWEDYKDRYLKS